MRYAAAALLFFTAVFLSSQPSPRVQPGSMVDGSTMLNSGWRIKPAGRQIPLGTLPMSTALSPNGRFLVVLNGGYLPPSLTVFDAATMNEIGTTPIDDGWLGLTFSPNGKFLYVGGGSQACVYQYSVSDAGKLSLTHRFDVVAPASRKLTDFIGDVQMTPDGHLIYAAAVYRDSIFVINPQSGIVTEEFKTGRRPYRILFHPDGHSFFVTSWADATLYHHNADTGEKIATVRLGAHPTDMVWRTRKGDEQSIDDAQYAARLFVSAANTNTVYVVAVAENKDLRMLETVNVAMTPMHPIGMTPSALGMNKDESRLHVVCSDANAVAVVDVTEPRSHVLGFIPTGWYPTAVRSLPDNRLVVLNGRGLRSFANPAGPNPAKRPEPVHMGVSNPEYVARLQTGTASVIDPLDDEQLDAYTKTVLALSPYNDNLLEYVNTGAGNPIPSRPGDASPIQHVIYVIKENRTYDQVLGDVGKGNSDASLTLFGEKYTPNHHKLAREFVLFDNFYVNADVSADGHNWSSSGIANDYVQKMWPTSYAKRRNFYDFEGGEVAALPPAGYIWSNAIAAGLTYRNYAWWTSNTPKVTPGQPVIARTRDPQLAKYTNMYYRSFDLDYPDVERMKVFLQDLKQFESSGEMPRLITMRLPNDHTFGMAAGKLSPFSLVADNDQALGMLVEAVSKSKFWATTAIFVLEDDAQNGPDHVDSHRSPVFVISPYTHRGVVDSTMYNTTSVLRTMELILGLRPMTHFDAGATPMFRAFAKTPNLAPYQAEAPRVSTTERNSTNPALAAETAKLDFSEEDLNDDDEMNDILWRGIRGTDPPPPVTSYFSAGLSRKASPPKK